VAKFTDCYAVGDILGHDTSEGQTSGASQFGKKAAELPIIHDYVSKTNPGAMWLVALVVGETDRDWWDKGGLKNPYYDVLTKRHSHVLRGDLKADDPKIPDILTFNGLSFFRSLGPGLFDSPISGRHEYYEIKPDNKKGIKDGQAKLEYIEKMYGWKRYLLPYKRGSFYPHPDRLVAQIPITIGIQLNSAFRYHINILLKRGGLRLIRLYLQLRRPENGLLLYKLCIELEDDDKKRNRQKVITKALAKNVYATYLATHYPQDFARIEPELGDYSYEGDKLPQIRCSWNVVDELGPLISKLETMMYVRGIALPGESYVVCCEEVMWQYLVRTMTVQDIWDKIKSTARSRLVSVGQGALWAQVQPLFLQTEDAASLAQKWVAQKSLIDLEGTANALLDFVRKNPGTAVAIALAPLFICAGVAALLEVGMLAATVAGSEAGISAAATGQVVGGLGRVALAEEILLGTRVGAGVSSAVTAPTVGLTLVGGTATATGAAVVTNAIAGTALETAVARIALAAGFLLMSVHTQAYAMGSKASGPSPAGAIPPNAKPFAEHVSGLFIVRAKEAPRMKAPEKGKVVNVRDVAEVPDPRDVTQLGYNPFEPLPAMWARYLGRVSIS
jgi:hypothetical protein